MDERSRRILSVTAGGVLLVLLMLYMGGFFTTGLIGPEEAVSRPPADYRPAATAQAERRTVPEFFEAVGTVASRTTSRIGAQVMARVLAVEVRAGDRVEPGDLLVRLDDRQLAAALEQTRAALEAATAAAAQAESRYRRVKRYYGKEAATEQMMEEAEAAYRQATAAQARARQAAAEAEVALGYARIEAPVAGQVAERLADPGDLAVPGRPLLVVQTPTALRLEAMVREGLVGRVGVGDSFRAVVPAAGLETEAKVEEVAPSADPRSRTFVVKAALPAAPGLKPGMFGRLLIPMGEQEVVLVPEAAVRRVGQLAMVRVRRQDAWVNTAVLTGRRIDGRLEVLSGLAGGETVALEGADE